MSLNAQLHEPAKASGVPHKNPTSPRPGPAPQVSHGQDGIPRHTPALLVKLSRICPLNSGNPAQVQGFPCWLWWSGAGSNCRPSAFQVQF